MAFLSSSRSRPLALSHSTEGQVYGLVTLAMGLTLVGVYIGMQFAMQLFTTGTHMLLLIIELAIVFTARWWMEKQPLNYLLFGMFPLLSGITITPFLLYIPEAYSNGEVILLNALAATVFMTGAAAVFARSGVWNLAGLSRVLFIGLLGLLFLGILQIFFPAFRTGQAEMLISGFGVILFALFLVYDLQRIQAMGRAGANPFMLALSLYLDIFNLFLYVVRFMLAVSGNRRS